MKAPDHGETVCAPAIGPVRSRPVVVYAVFLLSGLSALLYQVTWQRALMLLYGSNTESVAMVVSSFLVGLGLGNLAGGKLSVRPESRPLALFLLAEVFIGVYGIASLAVFRWAGDATLHAGPMVTGVVVFALLLVPTLCMGATLPLLVAHETRRSQQVGMAVSHLYFVNTVGAALGAFLSGFVTLGELGLAGTVRAAAALNGLSVLLLLLCTRPAKRR
jgi:spermidine synthase